MNTTWLIYLCGQIDTIRYAFGLIAFILGIRGLTIVCLLKTHTCSEEKTRKWYKKGVRAFIFAALFGLLNIFTPSSKTLIAMLVIPPIVDNTTVQKDAAEIYELTVEKVKKELSK